MAKVITMFGSPGITGTMVVKDRTTGALVESAAATEISGGLYSASFSTLSYAVYVVNLVDSSGDINWQDSVYVDAADTTYPASELQYHPDPPTIADTILTRNVSNVEAFTDEHTLATAILSLLEWSISGSTLTIKRSNGSTTHITKTLTSAVSTGDIITGIN